MISKSLREIKTSSILSFYCIGYITFTGAQSTTWVVPSDVTRIRALLVGGGGGGANGRFGGGGSGRLTVIEGLNVSPGTSYSVVVGRGGNGANRRSDNEIIGIENGVASQLGSFSAAGGVGPATYFVGGAGGSGGAAGGLLCPGVYGGTAGSNGIKCNKYDGGPGESATGFSKLSIFKHKKFTAGAGGSPSAGWFVSNTWNAGGGGGGVVMNGDTSVKGGSGNCPSGQATGGVGYGGGGAAGGGIADKYSDRYAGGKGQAGLVYIEWD